jgi:hypothetical protein
VQEEEEEEEEKKKKKKKKKKKQAPSSRFRRNVKDSCDKSILKTEREIVTKERNEKNSAKRQTTVNMFLVGFVK